jgi:hypothetical protein
MTEPFGVASARQGIRLYCTIHDDAHGSVDSYEHYTSGTSNYRNTYEGEERVSIELRANSWSWRETYR